jgi:4-aminobutyrate aminotransferase-like enzyme
MTTIPAMALIEQTAYLSPVWARYSDILVERGEGVYLYDVEGRRYLDFTCGIGVTNTGHCHPRVVQAIRDQAGLLLHGQANIVYHRPMLELVAELRTIVPSELDSFFFSNSGAEAVEGAVKLARQATGRSDIIAFDSGFHGRTAGAMALTSSKGKYRHRVAPLPAGCISRHMLRATAAPLPAQPAPTRQRSPAQRPTTWGAAAIRCIRSNTCCILKRHRRTWQQSWWNRCSARAAISFRRSHFFRGCGASATATEYS